MKNQQELNQILATHIASLAHYAVREIGSDAVSKIVNDLDTHFNIYQKTLPLALLNTTIATTDGSYKIESISLEEAIELVNSSKSLDSAIGHESTAQIMSTLLSTDIKVNRQTFEQLAGQQALVFKLKGRAPEGVILSTDEIISIGYEFKLMIRI